MKVDEKIKWYEKELFYIWQNNLKEDETRDILKQDLAKLFHEAVPEKSSYEDGDSQTTTAIIRSINCVIDQTHKNIDEMFK